MILIIHQNTFGILSKRFSYQNCVHLLFPVYPITCSTHCTLVHWQRRDQTYARSMPAGKFLTFVTSSFQ